MKIMPGEYSEKTPEETPEETPRRVEVFHKERRGLNIGGAITFSVMFIAWITGALYFRANPIENEDLPTFNVTEVSVNYNESNANYSAMETLNESLHTFSYKSTCQNEYDWNKAIDGITSWHPNKTASVVLLAALCTMVFVIMLPCYPKLFIPTIKISWTVVVTSGCYYVYQVMDNQSDCTSKYIRIDSDFLKVYIIIVILLSLHGLVYFIMRIDHTMIRQSTENVCSKMLRFRYLVLFGLLIAAMMIAIAMVTPKFLWTKGYTNIAGCITFILSIYLILFLYGYARSVVFLALMASSEMEDGAEFTARSTLKSIWIITRDYLGIIAWDLLVLPSGAKIWALNLARELLSSTTDMNSAELALIIPMMSHHNTYISIEQYRNGEGIGRNFMRVSRACHKNPQKFTVTCLLHTFVLGGAWILFSSVHVIPLFLHEVFIPYYEWESISGNRSLYNNELVIYAVVFLCLIANISVDCLVQREFIGNPVDSKELPEEVTIA